MSKLEEMIKELCPDGVEYKPLGEVCEIGKGIQFNKANMKDKGSYPVINGGINPSGYIEQFNNSEKTITISQGGASAGYVNWIDSKFWAGAHCYVIKSKEIILNRYMYHFIKSQEYKLQECQYGAGIPALSKSTVSDLSIPLPPLLVQKEIVRILDAFTVFTEELKVKLKEEREARRKQYEHYRDKLLSFDDVKLNGAVNNPKVEYKKLGEICEYGKERVAADTLSVENYVSVENLLPNKQGKTAASKVPTEYSCIAYKRGDVLIGNIRPYLKKIWLADCDGGTNGDVLVVQIKDKQTIQERFLYHCLSSERFFHYNNSNAKGAKMPRGDKSTVMNFEIPVPPLETQKQIVAILDKFEMLANSLSQGLPAEIEARKKQYEYYRDLLLDFKSAGGGYTLLDKLVRWIPLGEIATEMYRGAGIKRDEVTQDGISCVRYGEIYTTYDMWFDKCASHTNEDEIPSKKYFEHGDILFAITGESVEEIAKSCAYVGNEKCLAGGDIVVMKHKQNPKYLAYALSTTDAQRQKSKGKIKSKVVHTSVPSISAIAIPLPPLEIQNWIVEILDKFHSLVTDIEQGIPAEIEARKKQYEYYRNKLLSFNDVRSFRQAQ